MILKNSRYSPPRPFLPLQTALSGQSGQSGRSGKAGAPGNPDLAAPAFPGVLPRAVETAAGAIEYEVKSGDRLDLLARHYYNQDRLWWRIVDANPDIQFAGALLSESMVGQVILIPKAKD